MSNVVYLPPLAAAPLDDVRKRVGGILSIFHAIEAGELLDALPPCEVARRHHQAALDLLATAQRELTQLHADLAT